MPERPALARRPHPLARREGATEAARGLAHLIEAHRASALGPFLRGLARASVLAGAVSAAGCSSSHAGDDAGAVDTGTSAIDAGPSPIDAGASPIDAGASPIDAGPYDGGPPPLDATIVDGGIGLDAFVADGGGGEGGVPTGFIEPTCGDGYWLAVRGLSLTRAPAYLDAFDQALWGPYVVDRIGTPCDGAADMSACLAALEATEASPGRALRTTSGDLVQRRGTHAEVLDLLGAINTPSEAALLVWHSGYDLGCGDPTRWGVRQVADGYEVLATRMTEDCDPIVVTGYLFHVSPEGEVTLLSSRELERTYGVCAGRRPEGLDAARGPSVSAGAWFAELARLEAGAVHAFRVVAGELARHGAPDALVRDALAAAEDEVRHARAVGAIAARLGASVAPVTLAPSPPRGLLAMALENAIEGCVRETFGALVGHHQALAARDPEVRAAMAEIAEDETRHAALSWRIARWLEPQLTDAERASVRAARDAAVCALRAELTVEPDPELASLAGLPAAGPALELVDAMAAGLWR